MDCPLCDPKSSMQTYLGIANHACTAAFTIEFLVKVIGYGWINAVDFPAGYNEYMEPQYAQRAYWSGKDVKISNRIDFIILISSYVDMFTSGKIKPLVAIRAMKPLRLLGRSAGLKAMVIALGSSIIELFQTLAIVVLILLIFGVVGVSYMKVASMLVREMSSMHYNLMYRI